jgi:hypothetical protein
MLIKLVLISTFVSLVSLNSCDGHQNKKQKSYVSYGTTKTDNPSSKGYSSGNPWNDKCVNDQSCNGAEYQLKPKPPVVGAPGPLPIVGIFAAFGYSRRIHKLRGPLLRGNKPGSPSPPLNEL